ncbi:MAG: hypothetical protein M1812_007671 [Candelaria pacifica]|nr:MAG: hypothetical protein M1812_007671 [Candelaria pacifica]
MLPRLLLASLLCVQRSALSHRTLPDGESLGPPNKGPMCDPIIYGQPTKVDCAHALDSWVELISPPGYDFWHNSEDTFRMAVREYRSDDDTTKYPANVAGLGHVRLPLTVNVATCTVDVRLEPNGTPDMASWTDIVVEGMGAVENVCLKAYESVGAPIAGGYILLGEHNNIRATFYGHGAMLPKDNYPFEVIVPPPTKKQRCDLNGYTIFQGTCVGQEEAGLREVPVQFWGSSVLQLLFGVLDVKLWADIGISFLSSTSDS